MVGKKIVYPPKLEVSSIDNFGKIVFSFSEPLEIQKYTIEEVNEVIDDLFKFEVLKPFGTSASGPSGS